MAGLIFRRVFEDWETLDDILDGRPPDLDTVKRRLFILERRTDTGRPDHFYKNYRDHRIGEARTHGTLLTMVFAGLADFYLHDRGGRIFVHPDRMGEWQHLLPFLSPLSVAAFAMHRMARGEFRAAGDRPEPVRRLIATNIAHTALLTVRDPVLDDLVDREGLNETHLHLNGSTELDVLWLHALERPYAFHRALNAPANSAVQEQYEQISPRIDAFGVYRRVRVARRLRWLLTHAAFGGRPFGMDAIARAARGAAPASHDGRPEWIESAHHSLTHVRHDLTHGLLPLQTEAAWYMGVFEHLEASDDEASACAFHAYLLVLGLVGRLSVQQVDQFGFDQFQKYTWNGVRWDIERAYANRYHQLACSDAGDLDHLEGRFAPKASVGENAELLRQILRGYASYHGDSDARFRTITGTEDVSRSRRLDLGLVVHFIKDRERAGDGNAPCRHHRLRRDLERRCRAFSALLAASPVARRYVTGIDAAANEMHAPPEVFAAIFRSLRQFGMNHATFHVGEDFTHLLSGIRAVWEAVTFLAMERGDRIGHGTSIGIDPELWRRRVGPRLTMAMHDHLDDLVFAHERLLSLGRRPDLVHDLARRIDRLAQRIYGGAAAPSAALLHRAWRMRDLDPVTAQRVHRFVRSNTSLPRDAQEDAVARMSLDAGWRDRAGRAFRAHRDDQAAFELYLRYHSQSVRQAGRRWSEVATDDIPMDVLIELQHATIDELNRRGVAIETLPTSNVRISFYDDFADHHLFRWLGLCGDRFGADAPRPAVCVGSDDPGIFATNLRNEYAHILRTLTARYGLSSTKAQEHLRQLNETARAFRFRRPVELWRAGDGRRPPTRAGGVR
ncbi:hypothetical protein [Azospirillum aestuarii]|uniref:hypothetical protein n=1 Tax=Azospirillum aestuarii TaxID=2802052 RepID=UPI004054E61F